MEELLVVSEQELPLLPELTCSSNVDCCGYGCCNRRLRTEQHKIGLHLTSVGDKSFCCDKTPHSSQIIATILMLQLAQFIVMLSLALCLDSRALKFAKMSSKFYAISRN